ncbi:transposase [Roseateles sp.]|uniref:transposase n=1 Tax=Roseateles sp. TaxID=1971397 RepID=UPI0037C65A19
MRPLCWHYVGVHIEELSVEVQVAYGTSCESTVAWAMGMLADGDWEVLGAWPRHAVSATFWRGVKEDFDSRGVDKISLVCALDLDAPKLCGSVKVLPPFTRILGCGYVPAASNADVLRAEARRVVRGAASVRAARVALERLLAQEGACRAAVLATDFHEALELFRPFYALGTHYRALVRTGDEHLELLGRSLQRAVRRHGRFPDLAAATSFVADTLARHERRLRDRDLSDFERPLRCTDFPMARQSGRVRGRRGSLDGRSP